MPEIPATRSPDPSKSSPQPHDPSTPSPESHDPPIPREGSQSPAPVTQGRPRLKILIPLVLSVLGVALGLAAYFVVYPSPETGIPIPTYSKIHIETSVPIGTVVVNMYQGIIRVAVVLPDGAHIPPAKAKEDIRIELPNGANFYNCSDCLDGQGPDFF